MKLEHIKDYNPETPYLDGQFCKVNNKAYRSCFGGMGIYNQDNHPETSEKRWWRFLTDGEHSPEPWVYGRIDPERRTATAEYCEPWSPWIAGAGPRLVAVGRSTAIHADDMRRIVACVNACKGLKTEDLEELVNDGTTILDEIDTLVREIRKLV